MAQRSGCAALALAQVRIRDRQELDFVGNYTCTYCTVPTPGLLPYCTRTLCSCHATQYCSPPTKAAPVHLNPEHPRIPVIQTRFQWRSIRTQRMPDLVQRDLPRSFFREGRIGRGDGTVQLSRWAMGERPACLSGILRTVQ
jgi:hypothetical protein